MVITPEKKEYMRKYRLMHKQELERYQKNYNSEHRESKNNYSVMYARTHKEERKIKRKIYLIANKSKISEQRKKHRIEHKEEIKTYNLNYKKQNKVQLKEYGYKYFSKRCSIDALFRLRRIIGEQLNHSLKIMNCDKNRRHWETILGYTRKQLQVHLEAQFSSEMNWFNYGSFWHIDHVVPISWFKTSEQAIKWGWRLENLQPLEATLNLEKKNSYVGNPKTGLKTIYL